MKIVLIGAAGTLGSAVDKALNARYEIVRVGRKSGDFQVDITDPASIEQLFSKIGEFDAVVSTAGDVHFGPLVDFTQDKFQIGLRSKLMGQVNLVAFGLKHIRDCGSFTLTTGQINEGPISVGASGAMINGGLEAFARSAAIELPRGASHKCRQPDGDRRVVVRIWAFLPRAKACARVRRRPRVR
jgi:Enoyl-(Acyl carrier protein) reductase